MLKFASHRQHRPLQVYLVNYAMATAAAIVLNDQPLALLLEPQVLPEAFYGVFVGGLYAANLVFFGRSVLLNGIGLSVSVMRISLVMPVLVSVLVFHEPMGLSKAAGLVLTFAALGILFQPGRHEAAGSSLTLLVAIFLVTGIVDISLKFFQASEAVLGERLFMASVFCSAGLCTLVLMLRERRPWPTRGETAMGVLVGLPNLTASIFILMALERLPASVAFPVTNLCIIVGGTLLGKFYWHDHVKLKHYIVIVLSLMAILFLTLDV